MKGDPRTWIGILEHGDWERPGTLEVGTVGHGHRRRILGVEYVH